MLVNQGEDPHPPEGAGHHRRTGPPLIAVGDPSIVEFAVVSPRQLRVTGFRIGATDLSITTARNETYTFEIHVVADLTLIQGKLRSTFPDASIKLSQLRDHIVVEGEARDQAHITRIIETINAYLTSVIARACVWSGVDRAPAWVAPPAARRPGAGGGQTPPPASGPSPARCRSPREPEPARHRHALPRASSR